MLKAKGKKIIMIEGDYGLSLPITITGVEIADDEKIVFYITKPNGEKIIKEKTFEMIENNEFYLNFTKEESKNIVAGIYLYYLDWYKNEEFLSNIINGELFEVRGK